LPAQGLEAEVVTMGGSAATMKGLVSGDIVLGLAGGDAAIKANLAGADLVLLGGIVNNHYHRLVSRNDLTEPAQLKGRSIGLPFLGGPQDFLVQNLLDGWALGYGTDVEVRNMGREAAKLVALERNEVAAITSASPDSVVASMNLHVLANPQDQPAPYMQMLTTRAQLEKNGALIEKALRGLASAQVAYTADKAGHLAVLRDKLGSTPDMAGEVYDQFGPGLYSSPPLPDQGALSATLTFLGGLDDFKEKANGYDLTTMVDSSIVGKLVQEGAYKAP